MRLLVMLFSAVVAGIYLTVSLYLYRQEHWAREPPTNEPHALSRMDHPEAILALLRARLEAGDEDDELDAGLRSALQKAPASYQSPFLLATHHANRLEEPRRVRHAFEIALKRYPANGRIHVAYGIWLLTARADLAAWRALSEDSASTFDPLEPALGQLKTGVTLEPALLDSALSGLARYRVPPGEWEGLVPDDDQARLRLVLALQESGNEARASQLLGRVMKSARDPKLLRHGIDWALAWHEPELALAAAEKWLEEELEAMGDSGSESVAESTLSLVRLHLALGDPDSAYRAARVTLDRLESSRAASRRERVSLLCAIGYQLSQYGQLLLAESLFTEATALDPGDADAALALARSLRQTGNLADAIEQYEYSLRLDANLTDAKTELSQLLAGVANGARGRPPLEGRR
jgi:Tfp pilus assembly protein PilF